MVFPFVDGFWKLVSAAGVAPAVTRSQAEHVAATLRAVCPGGVERPPGSWLLRRRNDSFPGTLPRRKMADSKGLAPSAFPQTTGCSASKTKNKHRYGWLLLRSHRAFAVDVSVFRGTPPPKPLECKLVIKSCRGKIKNPASVSVSRVQKSLSSSLPACLQSIRIGFGF